MFLLTLIQCMYLNFLKEERNVLHIVWIVSPGLTFEKGLSVEDFSIRIHNNGLCVSRRGGLLLGGGLPSRLYSNDFNGLHSAEKKPVPIF